MIGRIISTKRNRPCSCSSGKKCPACKTKKIVHPRVIVEDPKRLPAPVTVTYYKPPQKELKSAATNAENLMARGHLQWGKQHTYESPAKTQSPICRWYTRRKALRELAVEYKKEQEYLKQRRREEYERERMKELMKWDEERKKALSLPQHREEKLVVMQHQKPSPPPKKEKKKIRIIKEKSTAAKPVAQSKYVSVKKLKATQPIADRFVNTCYRLCCQFYCYLTCTLLIVAAIVLII